MTGIGSTRASRRAEFRRRLVKQAEETKATVADAFESNRKTNRRSVMVQFASKVFRIFNQWQCGVLRKRKNVPVLGIVFVIVLLVCFLGMGTIRKEDRRSAEKLFQDVDSRDTYYEVEWITVLGQKKSGASYVRQLVLDNLFVDPLETAENDHHQSPVAEERRKKQLGNYRVSRNEPSSLGQIPEKVKKKTLVLFVTKDPLAWLVSALERPHHSQSYRKDKATMRSLLRERSTFSDHALALKQTDFLFEQIKYEDTLRDPALFLRRISHKYNFHPRRGSELLIPHHHTGDFLNEDESIQFHGQARRARYRRLGHFDRRDYYLDHEYLDDLDDTLIKYIRHKLINPKLENSLGYKHHHYHLDPLESKNKKRKVSFFSFSSLLYLPWCFILFFESFCIYLFFTAIFIMLILSPLIYFRTDYVSIEPFATPTIPLKEKRRDFKTPSSYTSTVSSTIQSSTTDNSFDAEILIASKSSPCPFPTSRVETPTSSYSSSLLSSADVPVYTAPVVPSARRQQDPGAYFAMWGGAPPLPGDLDDSSSSDSDSDSDSDLYG